MFASLVCYSRLSKFDHLLTVFLTTALHGQSDVRKNTFHFQNIPGGNILVPTVVLYTMFYFEFQTFILNAATIFVDELR